MTGKHEIPIVLAFTVLETLGLDVNVNVLPDQVNSLRNNVTMASISVVGLMSGLKKSKDEWLSQVPVLFHSLRGLDVR